MKEIVLDTETTGISVKEGHRIVEIGCIELDNLIPTKNKFHCYLNPERKVSEKALETHGYTDEFLSSKKKFKDIVEYQGGDIKVIDNPDKLPTAKHTKKMPAPKRGYVHTIDAGQLARGVQILAHGDGKKFDPASGVAELCKVGTQMKQGEPLMIIHYNDEKRLSVAMEYFKAAYRLAPKRPNPAPLVVERVA